MPHIVKKGETLSKVAKIHGITLARLLDANPQFKSHPDIVHSGDVLIIPGDEEVPPVPRSVPAPSPFARRLASVAQEQHDRFRFVNEADPQLCGQIKKWTEDIGSSFTSCTSNAHPWSAVFVSWCVKETGATGSEFKFSKRHSVFVHNAIQNAITARGVFHGLEISAQPPNVGDIIQVNRDDARFSFEFASTHSQYASHSVIVIEIGQDSESPFAFCIGGNEGDAIRRTVVRLTPQGFIRQRGRNPFICVIKTLK
jgi:hypothetical protein